MKVLVTGASGGLGRELVPRLLAAGHAVRGLSRRPQPPGALEWVRGDLRSGDGVAEAVRGVDVIVHAATVGGVGEDGKLRLRRAFLHPAATDVGGTRRLVEAATAAGRPSVTYVSIVGIDRVPVSYYRHKLQAEEIVRESGLPYTTVRITQFHPLIDALIAYAMRFPVALLPVRQRYQPIDPGEAAALTAAHAGAEPAGGIVEYGGPEQRTLGELASAWCAARGVRKRARRGWSPGSRPVEEGALLTDDRSGTITFEGWLKERGR